MKQRNNGFTLIEILISLGIFALGLSGILVLFPVGINAVQKSTEDTTAMFITESLHAALRASALKTEPGKELHFFFDGLTDAQATTAEFSSSNFEGKNVAIGIPAPTLNSSNSIPITPENYRDNLTESCYAFLGKDKSNDNRFGLVAYNPSAAHIPLQQYSYNIEIAAPEGNPLGLYDITFRIRRNNKVIKVFYTQLMIPTSPKLNSSID